jgi:hypothetical protein
MRLNKFSIIMSKKSIGSTKRQTSNNKKRAKINTRVKKHQKDPLFEGKERRVHEELINRRIGGGIVITKKEIAEAFAQARQQWMNLPGSIIKSSSDILLIEKRSKSKDTHGGPDQTHDVGHNGG